MYLKYLINSIFSYHKSIKINIYSWLSTKPNWIYFTCKNWKRK